MIPYKLSTNKGKTNLTTHDWLLFSESRTFYKAGKKS
jgi:hypothetical protein